MGELPESQEHAVVFRLKGGAGRTAPAAAETVELAKELVERASKHSGYSPARWNVFEHLGSFVVRAVPAFLLDLLDQPEVAAATLNSKQGGNIIEPIRPVRKRRATRSGWVEKA